MAINFPNSPTAGDSHSEAGINWVYDGEKWVAQSEATFWARTSSTLSPSTAGDNISTAGDLTAGCTTTGTSGSSGEAKVVGYQQGLWTVTSNANIATGAGAWTRIGNRVTAFVRIDFGGNSGASDCTISGLPYDADVSIAGEVGRSIGYVGFTNNGSALGFLGDKTAGDTFLIRSMTGSGSQLNIGNVNGLYIRGVVEYITDDTTWIPAAGATIS